MLNKIKVFILCLFRHKPSHKIYLVKLHRQIMGQYSFCDRCGKRLEFVINEEVRRILEES